ncbi:hypothetical protein PsYK624_146720 [Phanerochaete sordida]|uniref:Uncharacterized protein n=1 Tax=Phanerochaete sordida TaxID=48140 RepID=A0A9P3LLL8_9APHY|nr:hypothetical protein PsYK624_146720 [Phanerochaete sordida]
MAAAQAQVTQPQTASFTQFAFNVPQFQPMAVPATAQAGAAYFGAAQAQQTAAPARPQSAPPTQARLVPVDPSRMDADDVVWLDGRPYDKRAFADSLTPQMRAELARKTDDAFPTRKVPWIKWHVLCTYGFDPDDYPEAALAIERGVRHRVGEEVLPPLKDDSPSFQALILGETKERCRKMYKRWGKGKRSYTCEDVDDYVRPRHPCGHEILPDCPVHGHNAMHSPVSPHCHKHGHGAMHSAGWPGTPVSAHGVGTYQGFPAAQDGFSPRTAPLSTGYAFTAQQTMPATFTWPGLVPGSVPGLHSGHGWTFA